MSVAPMSQWMKRAMLRKKKKNSGTNGLRAMLDTQMPFGQNFDFKIKRDTEFFPNNQRVHEWVDDISQS